MLHVHFDVNGNEFSYLCYQHRASQGPGTAVCCGCALAAACTVLQDISYP